MSEPTRRYTFHPLERRGLLLGLDGGQLAVLIGGCLAALMAGRGLPGPVAVPAALIVLGASAGASLWRPAGRPLAAWLAVAAGWGLRRVGGPVLDATPQKGRPGGMARPGVGGPEPDRLDTDRPLAGGPDTGRPDAGRPDAGGLDAGRPDTGRPDAGRPDTGRPARRQPPPADRRTSPPGIDLIEGAPGPGHRYLGVIRDRRSGWWAAVVPVRGTGFALLDPEEQARRLEGWRAVLGTVARPRTPVRRLQWVQRSWTCEDADLLSEPDWAPSTPDRARQSYRDLVLGPGGAVAPRHDAWLVVAVGRPRRSGPDADGGPVIEVLGREVRLLEGQLRHADLQAGQPLDGGELAGLLAVPHPGSPAPSRWPWPLATDEAWGSLRADGSWHATYWISEWPRLEVGPDFLAPLLLGPGRRTVATVMAPIPLDRATRQVRAARAADVADEELRSRAGFLPSARREREAQGVMQRELELADGHAEYRFSGYVTVTAVDQEELAAACGQVEQAAQQSHLELRRLYGRQGEAYTWTLPLGRGLVGR